jgi:hypothetical protein
MTRTIRTVRLNHTRAPNKANERLMNNHPLTSLRSSPLFHPVISTCLAFIEVFFLIVRTLMGGRGIWQIFRTRRLPIIFIRRKQNYFHMHSPATFGIIPKRFAIASKEITSVYFHSYMKSTLYILNYFRLMLLKSCLKII